MRIIKLMMVMALTMALSLAPSKAQAQKKPLDHDIYDSWQSVSGLTLSDDGSAMVWSVNLLCW